MARALAMQHDKTSISARSSALLRAAQFLVVAAFITVLTGAPARAADVISARAYVAPEHTQLIFELSNKVSHRAFSLAGPDRLVVDLKGSKVKASAPTVVDSAIVRRVRFGTRPGGTARVVIDLNRAASADIALLEPAGNYGYRLVVQVSHDGNTVSASRSRPEVLRRAPRAGRDLIVAIDAGHGGDDSGAVGRRGTREKDITLQIARRLKRAIDAIPGLTGELTRNGDYYVGLRGRMKNARKVRADIFVSIHADAFRSRKVRGASVYALSDKAATSEAARWLARRQNQSDLLGGVSLREHDGTLASLLMDLQQAATMDSSLILADYVLGNMKQLGRLHKKQVQQAGFMVLRSPDIPSILVETAFISNPSDEQQLRSAAYQKKLAAAVAGGVRDYLKRYAPSESRFAQLQDSLANR